MFFKMEIILFRRKQRSDDSSSTRNFISKVSTWIILTILSTQLNPQCNSLLYQQRPKNSATCEELNVAQYG